MKKIILNCILLISLSNVLQAQSRVVLVEQFANSSCAPCGYYSPIVYDYCNNNPSQTAVIAYHTHFPYNNDSMYFENPVDADTRVNFYNVQGVPNTVIDGNIYNGGSSNIVATMSTVVNNRASSAPKYTISATSLTLIGNNLSGSFNFTSINGNNTSDNLTAHIVVIEKDVQKSAYAASPGANNETHYEYVMRKMLPNASGTSLANKTLNGNDVIPINWTLSHIKNKAELRVVAFVQNNSTKEVYQATLFLPQSAPVSIQKNEISQETSLSIFPNPSSKKISISLSKQEYITSLSIRNQLGQEVYSELINASTDFIPAQLNLSDGVYFLSISGKQFNATKKITVIND